MRLATEVGLDTLRAGRAIHTPLRHAEEFTRHLSGDELDALAIRPTSVNPNSGLWVELSLGAAPDADERREGLLDWLIVHENHRLHFGREHGGTSSLTCASPHNDGSDPHALRFAIDADERRTPPCVEPADRSPA